MLSVRLPIVPRQLAGVFIGLMFLTSASVSADVTVPDDPGHSWLAPLASRSLLVGLDQGNDRIFAVGTHGHILRASVKQLDSWQQTNAATRTLLNAVHMTDGDHGWAVGHDAVILKTTDGGHNWKKIHEAIDEQRPLLDVWFRDADNGIAIGAYGYFLYTSNGGYTWHDRLINEEHDYHLNAITDDGAGTLYIAAESGYVYRSRDRGKNWEVLNPPYEGSFFDVVAYDDTIIVVGLRGNAFVSKDAGETWRSLPTGVQTALTSITRLESGHVIITGHAGVVLLADPRLAGVNQYQLPKRSAFSDSAAIGEQLVLVGEHGVSTLNICRIFSSGLSGFCP